MGATGWGSGDGAGAGGGSLVVGGRRGRLCRLATQRRQLLRELRSRARGTQCACTVYPPPLVLFEGSVMARSRPSLPSSAPSLPPFAETSLPRLPICQCLCLCLSRILSSHTLSILFLPPGEGLPRGFFPILQNTPSLAQYESAFIKAMQQLYIYIYIYIYI